MATNNEPVELKGNLGMQRRQTKVKMENEEPLKAARIAFRGHKKGVSAVAVLQCRDRDPIVVSAAERQISLWSVRTGEIILSVEGHSARVSSLSTCVLGNETPMLVSGSWDMTVRIWPLLPCYSISGQESKNIIESESKVLLGHKNRIFAVDCVKTPDQEEHLIVSGSADNSIRVWSLLKGELLFKIFDLEPTWILCVKAVIISNAPFVVAGCKDNTVRVWRLQPPREDVKESFPILTIRSHSSSVSQLVLFESKKFGWVIVTACKDSMIRVWSFADGRLLKHFLAFNSKICALNVFFSSKLGYDIVVAANPKGNIRVWKMNNSELLRIFTGHEDRVNDLAIFLAPTNPPERRTAEEKREQEGNPENTESLDLVIVSGSEDTTVRTWLFAEEKLLTKLSHKVNEKRVRVLSMAVYAPEAKDPWIITGCENSTLRGWKVKRTTHVAKEGGVWTHSVHSGRDPVAAVAVYEPYWRGMSPCVGFGVDMGSPHVISGSKDGTIRLGLLYDGTQVGAYWTGKT
jgi:WD40 repeat protein